VIGIWFIPLPDFTTLPSSEVTVTLIYGCSQRQYLFCAGQFFHSLCDVIFVSKKGDILL
jgi:hypothetical protein